MPVVKKDLMLAKTLQQLWRKQLSIGKVVSPDPWLSIYFFNFLGLTLKATVPSMDLYLIGTHMTMKIDTHPNDTVQKLKARAAEYFGCPWI